MSIVFINNKLVQYYNICSYSFINILFPFYIGNYNKINNQNLVNIILNMI